MSERLKCGLTRKECKQIQTKILTKYPGGYYLNDADNTTFYYCMFNCSDCLMLKLLKENAIVRLLKNPKENHTWDANFKPINAIRTSNAAPKCPVHNLRVKTLCEYNKCVYYVKHSFYKNCMLVAAEHAKTNELTVVDISKLLNIPIFVINESVKKIFNACRKEALVEHLAKNRYALYQRMEREKICVVCYKKHVTADTDSYILSPYTHNTLCRGEHQVKNQPEFVVNVEKEYNDDFPVVYYAAKSVFSNDLNVVAEVFNTNIRFLRSYLLRTGIK